MLYFFKFHKIIFLNLAFLTKQTIFYFEKLKKTSFGLIFKKKASIPLI